MSNSAIHGEFPGKPGAAPLFRARGQSSDVEASPSASNLTPPVQRNAAAPRRYYLYLMAPAITILAFISLYPFVWLIVMSLQDVGVGTGTWVGFRNYTRLLSDVRFLDGWVLLLQYSAMCLALQLSIGLLLAVIVNNSRFEKFLVTALLMPMMMAPAVAGLVWLFLYNGTFGWYHWLLQSMGLLGGKSIIADADTAMLAIVLVEVWQWTPLITLIALAGLKRVPQDQLEAIDAALVLTGGGPGDATKILPIYLFEVAFKFFKLGRGAAIALTLLVVTIILGMILVRVFEKPKSERV